MQPDNLPSWFCPNCGHKNPLNFKHCTECGTGLPSQSAYPSQPIPARPTLTPEEKAATEKKNVKMFLLILGAVVGLSIFAAILGAITPGNGPPAKTAEEPSAIATATKTATPPPIPTATPASLIVVKSDWEKGGFGTIAMWKVTFKNLSDQPIGNIRYRTAYFSETGAQVDKGGEAGVLGGKPVQKVIPAKSTRTIEINDGFTHSEAHRASFELVGWEFVVDKR